MGINYYSRGHVEHSAAKAFPHAAEVRCATSAFSDMGWEIWPDGLREMLVRIHQDYRVPDLYVAENGAAMDDVLENGQVHDPVRRDYLQSHIAAVAQAREAGVPIVLAYLDYERKIGGLSGKFIPTGDIQADIAAIKALYAPYKGKSGRSVMP